MKKIVLICILIIILLILSIPISNNIIAKKVELNLKNTKMPPKTEIRDSISIASKLIGNGNGMQYFGAILIKTELSKNELENYYKEYRKNEYQYIIEKQNSNNIEVIELGKYEFKNIEKDELDKYYIIYSLESCKNSLLDLDIRGH